MKYIINKNIEDIEESDLEYLIDNEIIETKLLDYKGKLPGSNDSDKKEFLSEISSFANASGGDIIYGIDEDRSTGKPQGPLNGLIISNIDEVKQRLENIIINGLEPQLPSYTYTIQPITLANSNYVVIIRILKSWLGPHRISFKTSHKFYSRNSSGKYLIDVQELRAAFILSETVTERIKNFRDKRLSMILANESHIQFNHKQISILHIIPLESFNLAKTYDIRKLTKLSHTIRPMYSSTYNSRYNIDGYLAFDIIKQRTPHEITYAQLFRNGIIEAAEDFLFQAAKEFTGSNTFPISEIESELMKIIPEYLETLKRLEIEPPILISLNLFGVKGFKYSSPIPSHRFPVDRDHLNPPDVLIESYDKDLGKLLKPCFDSLWNAIGRTESPNYDKEGNWVEPR